MRAVAAARTAGKSACAERPCAPEQRRGRWEETGSAVILLSTGEFVGLGVVGLILIIFCPSPSLKKNCIPLILKGPRALSVGLFVCFFVRETRGRERRLGVWSEAVVWLCAADCSLYQININKLRGEGE